MPSCPSCGSEKVIKNGSIHNGKPKFSCKECRRQFVENPSNKIIPQETWNLVDKLLLEKISSAGISRVTGISEVWIQNYIKKYEHVPKRTEAVFKKAVWFCNVMKYVFCQIKREKSLDMACDWQIFDKNCRSIRRKQGQGRRTRPLEFTFGIMQERRCLLYWFLVSI